jgi:hypothetical protein
VLVVGGENILGFSSMIRVGEGVLSLSYWMCMVN